MPFFLFFLFLFVFISNTKSTTIKLKTTVMGLVWVLALNISFLFFFSILFLLWISFVRQQKKPSGKKWQISSSLENKLHSLMIVKNMAKKEKNKTLFPSLTNNTKGFVFFSFFFFKILLARVRVFGSITRKSYWNVSVVFMRLKIKCM